METVTVEVKQDHIDRLSKAKKPILGVAELIWNAFDADATEVKVRLVRNPLGAIQGIEVDDNGLGITYADAKSGFKNLGGSWKQTERQTRREKRLVHGKQGQGRFRGFAVGEKLEWRTTYQSGSAFRAFRISGDASDKRTFVISDEQSAEKSTTGTVACVQNVVLTQGSLEAEKAVLELSRIFALYLRQYPHLSLSYDGERVDPVAVQDRVTDHDLSPFVTEEGNEFPVTLTVVEWKIPIGRALYLCDPEGFALRETNAGIQAPGYEFTAYLKTRLLVEMAETGAIEMEEFSDLRKLLDAAKDRLRKHFMLRDTEKAASIVDRWKEEQIYPYQGEPASVLETTERQVFDVVAASVDSYLPDFKESKQKSKKLTFNLLRYAVESNPSALKRILEEVIGLPKDKQEEFAELLEKTSLTAMISAAKIVADRLEFLKGIEYLLFNPTAKAAFKERSQLHKMVSRNTWLFGDQFFLVNNDESLTNVLRKHVMHAVPEVDITDPVLVEGDEDGIVDILISKTVPKHPAEGYHNLVIELKRPSQKINTDINNQVKKYAFAVARDERFHGIRTDWTFWALSNDITEDARLDSEQQGRPPGVLWTGNIKNGSITIWVKTWAEVIEECRGRMQFFQDKLQYSATQNTGLKYLQATYEKFIPRLTPTIVPGKPLNGPQPTV